MTEQERRAAIVREAETWFGTPYRANGRLKGVGTNCAQFIYGVAKGSGILAQDAPEPKWFASTAAYFSRDERLAQYILAYGTHEISEDTVGPGDIVAYKIGQSHGHVGIVIEWPHKIIHCAPPRGCQYGHAFEGFLAQKHRRFFSIF